MKKYYCIILCTSILCLTLCSCKQNDKVVLPHSDTSQSIVDVSSVSEEQQPPFFEWDNTLSECQPIDKSLDCEAILLDRAEQLHIMMSDYLNVDKTKLSFGLGEYMPTDGHIGSYKVVSDEIKTYDDFRSLFSDSIYGGYIDKICSWNPRLQEVDGELYFFEPAGGYIGSMETWYLDCEVTDDKIIGHFAELCGVEDIGIGDAEYLNDESNYKFYEIVVQNVNGQYVLTDCGGSDGRSYYTTHGWLYNLGAADRSLITNEKVKPKETAEGDLVVYNGDRVVDKTDFEIFEKHFYGIWSDETKVVPNDVKMCYSGDTFSVGFYNLVDIYTESGWAYLVIEISGETTIYAIDTSNPNVMYEYYEANHGGRNRNTPDFTYKKTEATESSSLGFFGILKLRYADGIPDEVLLGNTLQTSDGVKWINYGERIEVINQNDNTITLNALCRAEGDNPYIVGDSDTVMESTEITYTAVCSDNGWSIIKCDYSTN